MKRLSFVFLMLCLALCLFPTTAAAQEPSETPTAEPECEGLYFPVNMGGTAEDGAEPERLIAPRIPDNPTQLDCGAYQFAQVCMACHGDIGQGLTEEWRAAWGREEMNCWQSKCHASNHPPEGFELPRGAPRLIGDGALLRFESAADLHNYISTKMPWHAPGSLDDKTYWQLVTFLANSNGIEVEGYLSSENAQNVRFRPLPEAQPTATVVESAPQQAGSIVPIWLFYGMLGGVLVAGVALGVWLFRSLD